MVSVILVFQWKVAGVEQPWLYKKVCMPHVPALGTAIWLHNFDCDWEWGTNPLFVAGVEWWENTGEVDVVLSGFEAPSDDPVKAMECMFEMGWSVDRPESHLSE